MNDYSLTGLRPGVSLGPYPEKTLTRPDPFNSWWENHWGLLNTPEQVSSQGITRFIALVHQYGATFENKNLEELKACIPKYREGIIRNGFSPTAVAPVFALIRAIAKLTVGMAHFDVQLMGGWVMLNGMIAEMQTGEGKSLTAVLPVCTAAFVGIPVHVVTVNDYLVKRDADFFRPLYETFNLTVASIDDETEQDQHYLAYRADITYCSNKTLVFDYLKDRMHLCQYTTKDLALDGLVTEQSLLGRLILRGLCFTLIDEADSVLIDDARTPLILSAPQSGQDSVSVYRQALEFASELEEKKDFLISKATHQLLVTGTGKHKISQFGLSFASPWNGRIAREFLVTQALSALHLFQRDNHYIIEDDKVVIIDENTGRSSPDRQWQHGLHQMIEVKEKVPPTSPFEILGRLSFQRFFPRYLRLAGMTGTAQEIKQELWATYRLRVISIPTRQPCKRVYWKMQVYRNNHMKWQAIIQSVEKINATGRPLLLGTITVKDSEHLSRLLVERGLSHQVLNARYHQLEAQIVAKAGRTGAITVATNMAGRGTDIHLDEQVKALGGLHVINCSPNRSRRIDRQIAGRSARQGDPGSVQLFASLEDDIVMHAVSKAVRSFVAQYSDKQGLINYHLGKWVLKRAYQHAEEKDRLARESVRQLDEIAERSLAFAGKNE